MTKRKLTEKEEAAIRSEVRPHGAAAEPVDTDDNDEPDADASGDSDDETENENQAGPALSPRRASEATAPAFSFSMPH
jgi:hypothetical protein